MTRKGARLCGLFRVHPTDGPLQPAKVPDLSLRVHPTDDCLKAFGYTLPSTIWGWPAKVPITLGDLEKPLLPKILRGRSGDNPCYPIWTDLADSQAQRREEATHVMMVRQW